MLNEPKLEATDEQVRIKEIIDNTNDNLLINAYAGSGKTTTLKMAMPDEPSLYLAFNKRIVEDAELERKEVAKTGEGTCFAKNVDIRTLNSLGHRVWGTTVGKAIILSRNGRPCKMQDIFSATVNQLEGDDKKEARDSYFEVMDAISKAKALGYIPEGKYENGDHTLIDKETFHKRLDEKPTAFISWLVDDILCTSIKVAYEGGLDFNDQVYMPGLFGGAFPRYPFIGVDEAQDLNPVNHALLHRLVTDRVSAVGDRWQSIYAFRGAVTYGMDRLRDKFSMVEADLSVSFRCPRAIVEAARFRAPKLKWVKDGGEIQVLRSLSPRDFLDGVDDKGKQLSAIICRNNAPLFRLAFSLLREGRSVSVAGSDLGPRILNILKKMGDDDMPKASVIAAIEDWRDNKLSTSQAPQSINDMADCMRIFAEQGSKLCHAVAYVQHLFSQKGTLYLTTGHKAKGLEWDYVYHLDPNLIGEQEEQELNLRYVIITRAKKSLFEISSKELSWIRKDDDSWA